MADEQHEHVEELIPVTPDVIPAAERREPCQARQVTPELSLTAETGNIPPEPPKHHDINTSGQSRPSIIEASNEKHDASHQVEVTAVDETSTLR